MVSLALWMIGCLGVGASGTISGLVWWSLGTEGRISKLETNDNIYVNSITGIGSKIDRVNDNIQQLQRDVDVLKAQRGK